MIRLILLIFSLILLTNNSALAGDCDDTIDSNTTSQLNCANNDTLTVNSGITLDYEGNDVVNAQNTEGVSVTNNGTIENSANDYEAPIDGVQTRNLTITNNGTITATKRYGIYINNAEQVTITNNADATINTDYTPGTASAEQGAIYGNKIGNCDSGDCYNSSDSNGGTGLTLHNYGTISSYYRTMWGGNSNSDKSKNINIYNYNGGSITSEQSATFKFRYTENFSITNYSGATLQSGTVSAANGDFVLDLSYGENITIDNGGTITSGKRYAIGCDECEDLTMDNSGTIEGTADVVYIRNMTGTNSITNSGTIKNTSGGRPIQAKGSTGLTITNTGTIESATQVAIDFDDSPNPTLINRGTIKSTVNQAKVIDFPQTAGTGTGGTLENHGTIINSTGTKGQGIRVGNGTATWDNLTIINSGTISSVGESIYVQGGSETSGLNIITKGEGTYVGEIEMDDAAVTMTLDCSISKDQDIELQDKTNMVIVNNLCGNDTYEILDSSKNADADNSETNGYLRIYGEQADVYSNNKKYRSEIFLSKLRKIYNSAKLDKEQTVFDTNQKRAEIYKNDLSGVVGYFDENTEIKGMNLNNFFMSYVKEDTTFDSGEYSGGKNLAFGYKKEINNEKFKATIVPMIGITDFKITDVESETNQRLDERMVTQFVGLNARAGKKQIVNEKDILSIEIESTAGLQKFPKYITNFTEGDLSVDDAIDQVLGAGFTVKYSKTDKSGFVIEPYAGATYNNTFSNDIAITADTNIEAGHVMNGVFGTYAGFTVSKHTNDLTFSFNYEHGDQDGLKENTFDISVSKKLQKIAKGRIEEIEPELEDINNQLKLIEQNEKLKELSAEVLEENKIVKQLLIELLKENQKLKAKNKLFEKSN